MTWGPLLAFDLPWLFYLGCTVAYGVWFARGDERFATWASRALMVTVVAHSAGLVGFGFDRGIMPPVSLGETLSVLSLAIALIFLYTEQRSGEFGTGPFAAVLVTIAAVASALVGPAQNIDPVLREQLFSPHAATVIASFASFTVAAFLSLAYLLQYRQLRSRRPGRLMQRLPALQPLDRMTRRTTRLGFFFLTIGLVLGAMLAQQVWGKAWSWDPKQCMTLLTWMLYGTALVLRRLRDWQGGRIATVNLIAFGSVVLGMFVITAVFDTAHRFG